MARLIEKLFLLYWITVILEVILTSFSTRSFFEPVENLAELSLNKSFERNETDDEILWIILFFGNEKDARVKGSSSDLLSIFVYCSLTSFCYQQAEFIQLKSLTPSEA